MSEEKKDKKIPTDKVLLALAVIGFFVVSILYVRETGVFKKIKNIGSTKEKNVTVDLFVMSQCPYGTQAEDAMKVVYDKMGDVFNYNINYIADVGADGTFSSLHGELEVKGNISQLCAKKYDEAKYLDMIACQNKEAAGIPLNWESCAKEANLENINKIKECYEGEEGKGLLTENIKLAQEKNVGGSPTYYLNNEIYLGNRDASSIMRAICSKIDNNHKECANIPVCSVDSDCTAEANKVGLCVNPDSADAKCEYKDPSRVDLIVLNDERCSECSVASEITDSLKEIFKGLVVKEVDYSSEEGRNLYNNIPGLKLPAFLFSSNVSGGEGYSNVQRYLSAAGDYGLLAVGSTFDPTKEICDNNVDDNKNGKIDCSDSDCSNDLVCRSEIKNRVDVFVMSDCPYGVQAENSMKEVLNNFGNKIVFNINYIATDNGNGTFSSLHGEYEAQEDIRQLCVKKYYPAKLMDYIWCRNEQGVQAGDWTTCATNNGIVSKTIETCTNGEGKGLLSANIKVAEGLGISASPTWLINNKYQASGIDAESIKKVICQYNSGLVGCENTLTSGAGAANTAAGCAAQ